MFKWFRRPLSASCQKILDLLEDWPSWVRDKDKLSYGSDLHLYFFPMWCREDEFVIINGAVDVLPRREEKLVIKKIKWVRKQQSEREAEQNLVAQREKAKKVAKFLEELQ